MRTMIIVVLSLVMVSSIGNAARNFGRHGWGLPPIDVLAEELALSPEQLAKVEELNYAFETMRISKHAELRLLHLQLDRALTTDELKSEELMKLVDKIHALRADVMKEKIKVRIATISVLTPEQKAHLRDLKIERRRDLRDDLPRSRRLERRRGEGRFERPMMDAEDLPFEPEEGDEL